MKYVVVTIPLHVPEGTARRDPGLASVAERRLNMAKRPLVKRVWVPVPDEVAVG